MVKMVYLNATNNDDASACYCEYSHTGTSDAHMTRVADLSGNTITPNSYTTLDTADPQPAWALDDTPWTEPNPNPVPESVTKYQFLTQALAAGLISESEAIMSARYGDIPNVIDVALLQMTPADQTAAKIKWASAATIPRDSDTVAICQAAVSMTNEQVDDFFRAAALIGA
jgi:hypothetical protein